MADSALKVSVVVATYRPGAGLDRLIASLDAQSLPHDEWEAVFVDDGSPDDTYDRLRELQRTRPWMHLEQIPNSGWPCRPRNVGTDRAKGEYVAYIDHDDALFPDALRDGYAFASRHRADAVNGKEARTSDIGWAIDVYTEDRVEVLDSAERFVLSPTNPHKLYRRAFLNEHGIRFREDGRVLWEDIFFNVRVARHATRVATMSSTPYYYWHTTRGSTSTTFRRSRVEWWQWLEEVCAAIERDLDVAELANQRTALLAHQYRARLLDVFNNLYERRAPAERQMIFEQARSIQSAHFPTDWDAYLNVSQRLRASLLRRNHPHALERLTMDAPNIPGLADATSVYWDKTGDLLVTARGRWVDSTGRVHRLVRHNDRIVKDLPEPYGALFATDDIDVTDEINHADVTIGVRSVRSRVSWMAHTEATVRILGDDEVSFSVDASARVSLSQGALGSPLSQGVWELTGRCTLAGVVQHRPLRGRVTPAISITDGVPSAAYAVPSGTVVLDIGQTRDPLPRLLAPTGDVEYRGAAGPTRIRLTSIDAEDSRIPTKVDVNVETPLERARRLPTRIIRRAFRQDPGPRGWHRIDATLSVGRDGTWLEAELQEGALIRLGERVPQTPDVYQLRDNDVVPYDGAWKSALA